MSDTYRCVADTNSAKQPTKSARGYLVFRRSDKLRNPSTTGSISDASAWKSE